MVVLCGRCAVFGWFLGFGLVLLCLSVLVFARGFGCLVTSCGFVRFVLFLLGLFFLC